MSAEAGKIIPYYTSVEIDEKGQIWLIQNYFESESVILEMESTSRGKVITNDDYWVDDYYADECYEDDVLEDYL